MGVLAFPGVPPYRFSRGPPIPLFPGSPHTAFPEVPPLPQVESQTKPCAQHEPVLGDFLLIAGFVDKLSEVIVSAVNVAIVAQPPFGVQIDGIACAAGDADLKDAAEANGMPEEAHHGVDRKPGATECQGGIVF